MGDGVIGNVGDPLFHEFILVGRSTRPEDFPVQLIELLENVCYELVGLSLAVYDLGKAGPFSSVRVELCISHFLIRTRSRVGAEQLFGRCRIHRPLLHFFEYFPDIHRLTAFLHFQLILAQYFIHASHTVAQKIHRHIREADRFEYAGDFIVQLEELEEFSREHFDTRQISFMHADAELCEAFGKRKFSAASTIASFLAVMPSL